MNDMEDMVECTPYHIFQEKSPQDHTKSDIVHLLVELMYRDIPESFKEYNWRYMYDGLWRVDIPRSQTQELVSCKNVIRIIK